MRTNRAWILTVLALLALLLLGTRVAAQLDDDDETPVDADTGSASSEGSADVPFGEDAPRSFTRNPDLEFYSEFPNNPFNALIAYERTPLLINITNLHESKTYRVAAAWGHLVNPTNFSQIVRNLTALPMPTTLAPSTTTTLSFPVLASIDSPDTAGMDLGLVVLVATVPVVEGDKDGEQAEKEWESHVAFQGVVRVAEQGMSYFSLEMLLLYAILGGLTYGLFTIIKEQFFPESKKPTRAPRAPRPTAAAPAEPLPKPTIESEWIPQHVKEVHGGGKRKGKGRGEGGRSDRSDRSEAEK